MSWIKRSVNGKHSLHCNVSCCHRMLIRWDDVEPDQIKLLSDGVPIGTYKTLTEAKVECKRKGMELLLKWAAEINGLDEND